MKRQLSGIAIVLLSILLMTGFNSAGWSYVFDFDIEWQHIFMELGIAGAVISLYLIKRIDKLNN